MLYKFFINYGNGYVSVSQPANHAALKLEMIFTSPTPSAAIESTPFEWLGTEAKNIRAYRDAGLTGGVGIYEGLPLRIEACDINIGFDLILDLANKLTLWECDKVVCPVRDAGNIDWLAQIAGSFGFWFLASEDFKTDPRYNAAAVITVADYKVVPYVISTIPDYEQALIVSVTAFGVGYQLYQAIKQLITHVKQLVYDASDLTILVAAGDIAAILIDVAEIAVLVAELVAVMNQLVASVLQPLKYKYAMRERDMFDKMCAFLGLTFSSTIYGANIASGYNGKYDDVTWMPRKILRLKNKSLVSTFLQSDVSRAGNELDSQDVSYGYFDGTCQEYIQAMSGKYNAAPVILNGVLHFEEIYYWDKNAVAYKMPNTGDLGYTFNYPDPSGTNASELPPTYLVEFQTDETELNTVQSYSGTTAQILVKPKVVNNVRHLLNPQGKIAMMPCALATRKAFFTTPEKAAIQILTDFNKAVIEFNTNFIPDIIQSSFGAIGFTIIGLLKIAGVEIPAVDFIAPIPIENFNTRLGAMLLSDDSFTVPKSFIGTPLNGVWGIKPYSSDFNTPDDVSNMTAIALMNNFHGKNLMSRGNQWITYSGKKIPFCCKDFKTILGNNIFITTQGRQGKFTKLIWNLEDEIGEAIDYRINENFTNNYEESLSIDGTKIN